MQSPTSPRTYDCFTDDREPGVRVSVLDAFESTWSNARSTFGDGTPETGAQFDGSAKLTQLQNSVSTAAPDGRWTGPASSAYGAAN